MSCRSLSWRQSARNAWGLSIADGKDNNDSGFCLLDAEFALMTSASSLRVALCPMGPSRWMETMDVLHTSMAWSTVTIMMGVQCRGLFTLEVDCDVFAPD